MADTREAGSRELTSPAAERGSSDQPVTGPASQSAPFDAQKEYDEATPIPLSDEKIERIVRAVVDAPSAYHRKLAEKIDIGMTRGLWEPNEDSSKPLVPIIAAVLASEQVVSAEEHCLMIARLTGLEEIALAEVERLVKLYGPDRNPLAFHNGVKHERERTAKIAELSGYAESYTIAAAIRAGKERDDD